jgi:hypothetical protein
MLARTPVVVVVRFSTSKGERSGTVVALAEAARVAMPTAMKLALRKTIFGIGWRLFKGVLGSETIVD